MSVLGLIIMVLGGIGLLIGNLWMLGAIFSTGFMWGIGSLLFGPIALVWLATHWDDGKYPFLINLASVAVFGLGMFLKISNEVPKRSANYDSIASTVQSAPAQTPRVLPHFDAGGTITLQWGGSNVQVKLANNMIADPAVKETNPVGKLTFEGDQTHLVFDEPHVITLTNKGADYAPLTQADLALLPNESNKLNVAGSGVYNLTSATLRLKNFEPGEDGDSLWHGTISVLVPTSRGNYPLNGTFDAVVSF
jgi:hypothetical protein